MFVLEQDHAPEFLTCACDLKIEEPDEQRVCDEIRLACHAVWDVVRVAPLRYVGFTMPGEACAEEAVTARETMERSVSAPVSVFVLHDVRTILEARKEYAAAEIMFEQRYFEGSGLVMYADFCEKKEVYCHPRLDELYEAVKTPDSESMLLLDQVFRGYLYHNDFAGFSSAVAGVVHSLNQSVRNYGYHSVLEDEEVMYLRTAKRMINWLRKKVAWLADIQRREYSDGTRRAMACIAQNYQDSMLSVDDIAGVTGLSVNRLNELFKREVGETVGKYLTRYRMEQAKKLIEDGTQTIQQVAEQTGYSSASYFSHVFRRTYGLAPQNWQKNIDAGQAETETK